MDWQASDFNNSWRLPFQALVRKKPYILDVTAIENSAQQFSSMVGIVDAQLGRTGAYVAGEHFTVADIAIGLSIHRWFSTPLARPTYVNVDRYYSRLLERSGFCRYGRDGGP
jgi:glutathione S-transferase